MDSEVDGRHLCRLRRRRRRRCSRRRSVLSDTLNDLWTDLWKERLHNGMLIRIHERTTITALPSPSLHPHPSNWIENNREKADRERDYSGINRLHNDSCRTQKQCVHGAREDIQCMFVCVCSRWWWRWLRWRMVPYAYKYTIYVYEKDDLGGWESEQKKT